jgi:hypothetical protein
MPAEKKPKADKTPGTTPQIIRGEKGRSVQKQHIWKWGDNPEDESQQDEKGWQRFKLAPLDTDKTIKTTREMLAGGVASGLPCTCGEILQWVQTVSALKMMIEAGWSIKSDEQRQTLANTEVAILVCQKCERVTQAQASIIKTLRAGWLSEHP